MVNIIKRLPSEKEKLQEVRRFVKMAQKHYGGRDRDSEIYYPKNGSWFSIADKNKRYGTVYVFPMGHLITYDSYRAKSGAIMIAQFFESERNGEFSVLEN